MSETKDKILLDISNAEPSGRQKIVRYTIIGVLVLILIIVAVTFFISRDAGKTSFVTEEVTLGNLTVTVSATGQLQPTNEVEVGSEISGLIESVYVDENDVVKLGQVLARLDTAKLTDQVTKSTAAVRAAEASVAQAQATVAETAANLSRLRNVYQLSGGKVPSMTEIESAEAAALRAKADVASARASVQQAIAGLKSDQTNLDKASIRSPIDGIVLTRQVEPGQTVAASLQTPVLFTLAENLTQMELQVDVDEADVGKVEVGQPNYFTVDAWPNRRYPAEITRVGFGSQIKDNVVTYKTILQVSNDDMTLRPGMTATAEITTASRENVLRVPNAALRFTPASTEKVEGPGLVASLVPRMRSGSGQKKSKPENGGVSQVWVLQNNMPVAVQVKTGLSDGRYTEIVEGDLQPGAKVITESQTR